MGLQEGHLWEEGSCDVEQTLMQFPDLEWFLGRGWRWLHEPRPYIRTLLGGQGGGSKGSDFRFWSAPAFSVLRFPARNCFRRGLQAKGIPICPLVLEHQIRMRLWIKADFEKLSRSWLPWLRPIIPAPGRLGKSRESLRLTWASSWVPG